MINVQSNVLHDPQDTVAETPGKEPKQLREMLAKHKYVRSAA